MLQIDESSPRRQRGRKKKSPEDATRVNRGPPSEAPRIAKTYPASAAAAALSAMKSFNVKAPAPSVGTNNNNLGPSGLVFAVKSRPQPLPQNSPELPRPGPRPQVTATATSTLTVGATTKSVKSSATEKAAEASPRTTIQCTIGSEVLKFSLNERQMGMTSGQVGGTPPVEKGMPLLSQTPDVPPSKVTLPMPELTPADQEAEVKTLPKVKVISGGPLRPKPRFYFNRDDPEGNLTAVTATTIAPAAVVNNSNSIPKNSTPISTVVNKLNSPKVSTPNPTMVNKSNNPKTSTPNPTMVDKSNNPKTSTTTTVPSAPAVTQTQSPTQTGGRSVRNKRKKEVFDPSDLFTPRKKVATNTAWGGVVIKQEKEEPCEVPKSCSDDHNNIDWSDMDTPTPPVPPKRSRGRPRLANPKPRVRVRKEKVVKPIVEKKAASNSSIPLCASCKRYRNIKGHCEKFLVCSTCSSSFHPSCANISRELAVQVRSSGKWQCVNCQTCSLCSDPLTVKDSQGTLSTICSRCADGFHLKCLKLEVKPISWDCDSCQSTDGSANMEDGNDGMEMDVDEEEKEKEENIKSRSPSLSSVSSPVILESVQKPKRKYTKRGKKLDVKRRPQSARIKNEQSLEKSEPSTSINNTEIISIESAKILTTEQDVDKIEVANKPIPALKHESESIPSKQEPILTKHEHELISTSSNPELILEKLDEPMLIKPKPKPKGMPNLEIMEPNRNSEPIISPRSPNSDSTIKLARKSAPQYAPHSRSPGITPTRRSPKSERTVQVARKSAPQYLPYSGTRRSSTPDKVVKVARKSSPQYSPARRSPKSDKRITVARKSAPQYEPYFGTRRSSTPDEVVKVARKSSPQYSRQPGSTPTRRSPKTEKAISQVVYKSGTGPGARARALRHSRNARVSEAEDEKIEQEPKSDSKKIETVSEIEPPAKSPSQKSKASAEPVVVSEAIESGLIKPESKPPGTQVQKSEEESSPVPSLDPVLVAKKIEAEFINSETELHAIAKKSEAKPFPAVPSVAPVHQIPEIPMVTLSPPPSVSVPASIPIQPPGVPVLQNPVFYPPAPPLPSTPMPIHQIPILTPPQLPLGQAQAYPPGHFPSNIPTNSMAIMNFGPQPPLFPTPPPSQLTVALPGPPYEFPTNPSTWTSYQVELYLREHGLRDEGAVFREQEIDGISLMLMRRADIVQGMRLKLGPALKVHRLVSELQSRGHGDPTD